MLLHDLPRPPPVRVVGDPLKEHHARPVQQRAVGNVAVARDPPAVGRTPGSGGLDLGLGLGSGLELGLGLGLEIGLGLGFG